MSDIDNVPTAFDDYEVHGVREFGRGAKRYCEQVPDEKAQFWSLYGHISGQGLNCIGNFRSRASAEEVYARITGRVYGHGKPSAAPDEFIDVDEVLRERRQVAVIWCTDDVQSVRPDLSDDEAWRVLKQCRQLHDCELGFTWLLIETVADDLFPEPSKTSKED